MGSLTLEPLPPANAPAATPARPVLLAGPATSVDAPPAPSRTALHAAREANAHRLRRMRRDAKIVMPLRYSAWLNGDMGDALEKMLRGILAPRYPGVRITRLPRAFLVEAAEEPGPFLEGMHRAALELESGVAGTYPVLHHEIGPVWTGTLQTVFA